MAKDDLDLVVHLGDYIYEYAGTDKLVRKHVGAEIETLDDYRIRHAQYRTDPLLQAAHARCPWVVTWDDHEVDNNYAGDVSEETGRRPGRVPGAAGERLPGLLRDDAAAAPVAAPRAAHAALPQGPVRPAGRRSSCSTPASTAPTSPTATARSDLNDAALDPQNTLLGAEQADWL